MTAVRPTALIFRKYILGWSETFIATQAGAMARYAPVLTGYHHQLSGQALTSGMPLVLLDDHSTLPALDKFLIKAVGRMPPRWLRAIAAHAPTLIHAHFEWSVIPGANIARALGIPLILTYHGADINFGPRSRSEVARRRVGFAAASRIIAVSEYIARRVREVGCPPDKVVVHYIGVDTDEFTPGKGPRVPDRVLFVGRLVAKKGVIHLLRAMREVQRATPSAELVIAGDGALRPALEREAHALGVRASFLGVQTPTQIRELMQSAALIAGPSIVDAHGNGEGLGMVFIEAQACGTPVVVADSGGAAEGVVDGETGLLFAPGDEDALARHILALLGDPGRRQRMGTAARAHIERNFNLRRQTAVLEAMFDEVRLA